MARRTTPGTDSTADRQSSSRFRSASRELAEQHEATARVTRSQSRQASVGPERETSRASRASAAAATPGPHHTTIRGQEKSKATTRAQQLDTVREDMDYESDAVSDMLDVAEDAVADVPSPSLGLPGSSGALSRSPSQQSVSTTMSEQIANINPKRVLDELSGLHFYGNRVLRIVLPDGAPSTDALTEIVQELTEESSEAREELSSTQRKFNVAVADTFGEGNQYCRPDVLLCALLSIEPSRYNDFPNFDFRPDEIFFLANLASMVMQVFTRSPADEEDIHSMLESVDTETPHRFVSSLADSNSPGMHAGSSGLVRETFNFALNLRTQLAIFNAKTSRPQTAAEVRRQISQVMLVESDEDPLTAVAYLENARGWDDFFRPEDVVAGERTYASYVIKRTEDLMRPFLDMEDDGTLLMESLEMLQESFPWQQFLVDLLAWVAKRKQELDRIISARGGVNEVESKLKVHVTNRAADIQADIDGVLLSARIQSRMAAFSSRAAAPASSAAVASTSASTKRVSAGAIAKLLSYGKASTSKAAMGTPTPTPTPTPGVQHSTNPPSPRKRQLSQLVARQQQQRPVENKENHQSASHKRSLMDEQPRGHRVVWDEGSQSQSTPHSRSQQPPPASVDTVSEDEGFQEDERPPPSKRRVHYAPAEPARSAPTPRPTLRQSVSFERDDAAPDMPAPARKNPGQALSPLADTPAQTQAQRYRLLNARNKINRRCTPIEKVPRARQPWADEEIDALYGYIAEYGCKWALIKNADSASAGGGVLAIRNAEDLRFKARLLMVDELMSNRDRILNNLEPLLPEGFENVRIGAKEIEQLHRQGVPFQQDAVRSRPAGRAGNVRIVSAGRGGVEEEDGDEVEDEVEDEE